MTLVSVPSTSISTQAPLAPPKMTRKSTTRHHCPRQKFGNCIRAGGICTKHQEICPIHQRCHLQDEPCRDCDTEKEKEEEKNQKKEDDDQGGSMEKKKQETESGNQKHRLNLWRK